MRKEIIKTLIGLCLEINGAGDLVSADFWFLGCAEKLYIDVYTDRRKGKTPDMSWELCTDRSFFNIKEYEDAYDSLLSLRDSMHEGVDSSKASAPGADSGNWF